MAFVVEDGTGKDDANSYGDVAGADAYFAERGVTSWVGSNEVKQQKLIQATDYIDTRFGLRFKGSMLYPETPQALAFPRTAFEGMPPALLKATYEYALRALSGPLAPDPATGAEAAAVRRKKTKVGPLEKETEYVDSSAASNLFKPYPMADALIATLLTNSRKVYR